MKKSFMADLNRLMSRQNFKDEKELQAFLDSLTGKSLELPEMDLTPEEQAQDLVFEAYELTTAKAKKKIEKALELDPNCIEAYEYLASRERTPEKALELFEKGIAIGRKKFGGKFLKENKGDFWGWHPTRPFMRCLYNKVDIYIIEGKTAEGAAIMEELLELNDGDNQGARYPLLSALIMLDETAKFKKYDKMFYDEDSTQMLYSRALFAFKTEGDSDKARKMLQKALEANRFIIFKLFDENFQLQGVESYKSGSPEEAEIYLAHAFLVWHETEGAIEWLAKTIENVLKKETAKEKISKRKKT